MPASALTHPTYQGGTGRRQDLWARAPCTPGPRSPRESPRSLPVYGRGPIPEEGGSVIFLAARYLPGLPVRFSRAFLSFGFHGDLGRQEIRQSFRQLCEGKQEAGRREAGQHRPAPPRQALGLDSALPAARGRGAPGRGAGAATGASSLIRERKSRSLALVKENTALASGSPMSWEPQARPAPPACQARPAREFQGPPGSRDSTLGHPCGAQWLRTSDFSLHNSSREETFSAIPSAETRREAGTPRETSPASAPRDRGSLFPTQRACRQRSPRTGRLPGPRATRRHPRDAG